MRAFIGAIFGVVFVYLFGSAGAWDLDPSQWSAFWRVWCLLWGFFWCIVGALNASVMIPRSSR